MASYLKAAKQSTRGVSVLRRAFFRPPLLSHSSPYLLPLYSSSLLSSLTLSYHGVPAFSMGRFFTSCSSLSSSASLFRHHLDHNLNCVHPSIPLLIVNRCFTKAPLDGGNDGSRVVSVENTNIFHKFMDVSREENKLVMIYFTAKWCHPCRMISPKINELSIDYAHDLAVAKVDIDKEELQDIVAAANINAVPYFQFFRGGKLLSSFAGADQQKLIETISLLRLATEDI